MLREKTVLFVGQRIAEEMLPIAQGALISIADSQDNTASIAEGWGSVHRFYFIDGSYTPESLDMVGINYRYIYASYFNRELALEMRATIERLVEAGCETIVVHCHAGKSRSAAVASYISERHGYRITNRPDHLNVPFSQDEPMDSKVLSYANEMIHTLLWNPYHFDPILSEINARAAQTTPHTGFWQWFRSLF